MKAMSSMLFGFALILASAGMAIGQSDTKASGSTTTGAQGGVDVKGPIDAQGTMQTATKAEANAEAEAAAKANATLNAIRERATKTSNKTRMLVEKELAEISRQIDAEANEKGEIVVAGRIAPEFGLTAEAMLAEQGKFQVGMGELTIAHTLMANSKTTVIADQIFMLQREGFGWGQIAYGLNLRLGEVVAAVRSEGNVAAGRAKADGKPAVIHSSTRVATSTNAGIKAGPATAGAATSAGAGVGVKVGK